MPQPETIRLILPMPPSSNRYWRSAAVKNKSGKWIAVTYLSDEAKEFKKIVQRIACRKTLIYGEVVVTVKVFRARRSGDFHNRKKVLYDAMQGIVYANDSQIVEDHGFQRDDAKRPRVEVEIQPLGLC